MWVVKEDLLFSTCIFKDLLPNTAESQTTADLRNTYEVLKRKYLKSIALIIVLTIQDEDSTGHLKLFLLLPCSEIHFSERFYQKLTSRHNSYFISMPLSQNPYMTHTSDTLQDVLLEGFDKLMDTVQWLISFKMLLFLGPTIPQKRQSLEPKK